jgi:hypothetical protein
LPARKGVKRKGKYVKDCNYEVFLISQPLQLLMENKNPWERSKNVNDLGQKKES